MATPVHTPKSADNTFVDNSGEIIKGIWTAVNAVLDSVAIYAVQVIDHHTANSPQLKTAADVFKQYYPLFVDIGFGGVCLYSFWHHPTIFVAVTVAGFILSANIIPSRSFKALHQSILGKTNADAHRAKLTTFVIGSVNYRSSQFLVQNVCTIWTALFIGNMMYHHCSPISDKQVDYFSNICKSFTLSRAKATFGQ